MASRHTITVRVDDDLYEWLVSRQSALYADGSLRISISTIARQMLTQVKRAAEKAAPRRKNGSR
jgi:hypothetical protein